MPIKTFTSPLERVNIAAKAFLFSFSLKEQFDVDQNTLTQNVRNFAGNLIQTIQKELIIFSCESEFDIKRLNQLSLAVNQSCEKAIQENPEAFDPQTALAARSAVLCLDSENQRVQLLYKQLLDSQPIAAESEDKLKYNPYKDRIIDQGVCYGHCVALMEERDAPLSTLPFSSLALERERKARFFQLYGKIADTLESRTIPHHKLGELILKDAKAYPLLMRKLASFTGYANIDQLLNAMEKGETQLSFAALAGIAGAHAEKGIRYFSVFDEQVKSLESRRDDALAKLFSLKNTKTKLEAQKDALSSLVQSLHRENALLDAVFTRRRTDHDAGSIILNNPQHYFFVIQQISAQHGYPPGKENAFLFDNQNWHGNNFFSFIGNAARSLHQHLAMRMQGQISNQDFLQSQIDELSTSIQNAKNEERSILDKLNTYCKANHAYRMEVQSIKKLKKTINSNLDETGFYYRKELGAKKVLASNLTHSEVPKHLTWLSKKKKDVVLILEKSPDSCDHAVYVSFDPPILSDANDSTIFNGYAKTRPFLTKEALIEEIESLLTLKYQKTLPYVSILAHERRPISKRHARAAAVNRR